LPRFSLWYGERNADDYDLLEFAEPALDEIIPVSNRPDPHPSVTDAWTAAQRAVRQAERHPVQPRRLESLMAVKQHPFLPPKVDWTI